MPRWLVTRDAAGTVEATRTRDLTAHPHVPASSLAIVIAADTATAARSQLTQFRNGTHARQELLATAQAGFRSGAFDASWLSVGPDGVVFPAFEPDDDWERRVREEGERAEREESERAR